MPLYAPLADRFWAKVVKTETCWLWTASKDHHGYGQINATDQNGKKRPIKAHQVAWFLHHGQWSQMNVLHRCDVPSCVRIDHLFEGTKADNTADMMRKHRHNPRPRQTHCKRGHEMTIPNTLVKFCVSRWKWQRSCRECGLIAQRERRAREKSHAAGA